MYCKVCGKEINDRAVICPFCGCSQIAEKSSNGLSVAGFVISLVSFFISFFCAVPIIGLVLSCMGLDKAKINNNKQGLAIAGIILGIISTLLNALFLFGGFTILELLFF